MRRPFALLFALGALVASPAEAQTLVLCDADWMDVERVLALITVEVDEPSRYVFGVTDCSEESARVAVSGPNGLARERQVRLASTAPEARSRLVALVLVELIRLGTRERPEQPVPPSPEPEPPVESEPAGEPAEPAVEPGGEEDVPALAARPWAPDPYERVDEEPIGPEPEVPPVAELPWAENPYQRFEGTESTDSSPEVAELPATLAEEPSTDPCSGDGLVLYLSARGCSTAIGIGVGVARHHLGTTTDGSLLSFQGRLRFRWRFAYFGARAAGRLRRTAPSGASVNLSAYTAFAGLELGSVRFARGAFAVGVQAEAGAIRFRELNSTGGCSSTDFFSDCSDGPQVGSRPTFGGMLSLRLEVPVRKGGVAFELEGGWMRGLMVSSFFDPVAGLGGAQLSFLVEATFGLRGAS